MTRRLPELILRDAEMERLYRDGKTLEQIGAVYGISRERVRQCLAEAGLTRLDGGQTIRIFKETHDRLALLAEKRRERDARKMKIFGVDFDTWKSIGQKAVRTYNQQRKNARVRGIGWEMTLGQWWAIWQESGKWELRGRGKGYCMARSADLGPYSPENVYICTIGENFSHSYIAHPWQERFANVPRMQLRADAGIWCDARRPSKNPFAVYLRKKYVGSFPTREAAIEARRAAIASLPA